MIKERTRLLRKTFRRHFRLMGDSIAEESRAAAGMLRWWAAPQRYTMVHVDDDDFGLHPWGARWRRTIESDKRICSHCRSIHPDDFLEVIADLRRWDPYRAHREMAQLMERGEVQPSLANHFRSGHAPEGFFIGHVHSDPDECSISVHTWECKQLWLRFEHLCDLTDGGFYAMRNWLAENMPELAIAKDASDGRVIVSYNPAADPMNQPHAMQIIRFGTPEDDIPDPDPQGEGPHE